MGKGCSGQPYCISTIHGGHPGSGAGMTMEGLDDERGADYQYECMNWPAKTGTDLNINLVVGQAPGDIGSIDNIVSNAGGLPACRGSRGNRYS